MPKLFIRRTPLTALSRGLLASRSIRSTRPRSATDGPSDLRPRRLRERLPGAVRSGDGAPAGDQVVDDQHHDGADHRDEHAVEVEAGHPGGAELGEQPAADDRADDAEHDVEDEPLAGLVDDLAGDEAGDQPEHDPADEGSVSVTWVPPLRPTASAAPSCPAV